MNTTSDNGPSKAPVLFLIFNRPDTTMRVFEAIRNARPPRLYVASDGPRDSRPTERAVVTALRDQVLAAVDWPCEVRTLFRDANLGCRNAVSGAITWFFEHEERGIILEDDCLPHPTFFRFCEELLEKYADDPTVAGITGDYRQVRGEGKANTYGRVGYPLIWGWASWRRVWWHYDPDIKEWTGDTADFPRMATKPRSTRNYLTAVFDAVQQGKLDTWDFQFNFLCQRHQWDFLHPQGNLITNIGFSADATHTSNPDDPNAALPTRAVQFPLLGEAPGRAYEEWLDKKVFSFRSITTKAMDRLYRWSMRGR
jgi:hypothetical protein